MTAWRWWREGKLPVPQAPSGTIIVEIPARSAEHTFVYARVSSDQAQDLDRQVARVTAWVTERGHPRMR